MAPAVKPNERREEVGHAPAEVRAHHADALGTAVLRHVATHPVGVGGALYGPDVLGVHGGAAVAGALDGWFALEGGAAFVDRVIAKAGGEPAAAGVALGGEIVDRLARSATVLELGGPPLPSVFDGMLRRAREHRAVPSGVAEDVRAHSGTARGTAATYLTRHWDAFLRAIGARLAAARPPTGCATVHWSTASFGDAVVVALGAVPVARVPELVAPDDLHAAIDRGRSLDDDGKVGALHWEPTLGVAVASLVEHAIRAALPRVATRFAAAASGVVASHPIDRVIANALAQPDVVLVTGRGPGGEAGAAPTALRPVALTWLGRERPDLWNWARVDAPLDPTPEELAHAIFGDTARAYHLALTPPLVQVPESWAVGVPDAIAHRPHARAITAPDTEAPALQLIGSALGDRVAEAQLYQGATAGPAARDEVARAHDRAGVVDLLQAIARVQAYAFGRLAGLVERRAPDTGYFQAKLVWASTAPLEDVVPLRAVFARQRDVVTASAAMIGELVDGLGATPKRADVPPPALEALGAAAAALEAAPLVDAAEALLARAATKFQGVGLAQLVAQNGAQASALAVLREQEAAEDGSATHARATVLDRERLRVAQELADARSEAAAGVADPTHAEHAQRDARRLQLRIQVAIYQNQVAQARGQLDDATHGRQWLYNAASGHEFNNQIREHLVVHLTAEAAELAGVDAALRADGDAGGAQAFAAIEARFQRIAAKLDDPESGVARMQKLAMWAGVEKMLGDVAVETGATFGVAAGARAVAGAVRGGVAVARGIETVEGVEAALEIARKAARAGRVAGAVTELTAQSAIQVGMHGGSFGRAMLENTVATVLTKKLLGPIERAAQELEVAEKTVAQLAKAGKGAGAIATRVGYVSSTMLLSAAINHATRMGIAVAAGEELEAQTVEGWGVEGASMAFGHALGTAFEDDLARLEKLGARAAGLRSRLAAQRARMERGQHDRDPGALMQAMAERHALLVDEMRIWESLANDPQALHAAGVTREQIAELHGTADALAADLRKPARLAAGAGLTQEVPGTAMYAGTSQSLDRLVEAARGLGVAVAREHDATAGVERVRIGEQTIEVRVQSDHLEPRAGAVTPAAREVAPHETVTLAAAIAPHGDAIARGVGEATFDRGGFTVSIPGESIRIELRHGASLRTVREGEVVVLEVPPTLQGAALEAAVIGKLTEVRIRAMRRATGDAGPNTSGLGAHGDGKRLSVQEHGAIAELRILRERAAASEAQHAELEPRIAALEEQLGLRGASADAEARRRAVATQMENQASVGTRGERDRELNGERGHAGVEVHNHFAGVVQAEVFRNRASRAAHDGADDGSWVPLLERIVELGNAETNKNKGKHDADKKHVFNHKLDGEKIAVRAKSGDAIAHARGELDIVNELLKQIGVTADDEVKANLRHAAELIAREASKVAIQASQLSDFDSAYEVRGELIADTFGPDDPVSEPAAPEPKNKREREDRRKQRAWNDYTREAVLQLARDGVGYSEQSTGTKRVEGNLHPDKIQQVIQAMIERGELNPGEVEIRMLAMTLTGHFGQRDPKLPPVAKPDPALLTQDLVRIKALLHQAGVVGPDIGAPEAFTFDELGKDRFTHIYRLLALHAMATGEVVVFRPHVGEGALDTVQGEPYHTDKNRIVDPASGELPHYQRARDNIGALLSALEALHAAGELDPGHVIVRFGHVTHATPDQLARMKSLGVIAEINLGSNVSTGVLSQTRGITGPRSVTERFEDHSLPSAIYYDVDSILSTDGGAVMDTSLRDEYTRARLLIEQVLAGERPVRIRTADAHERGHAVPGREDLRELTVAELTAEERARFERAYQELFGAAQRYYERRPKPEFSTPTERSPFSGTHHSDIARRHGLATHELANQFEGTRAQVKAATSDYRARGFGVVESDTSKIYVVTVRSPDDTTEYVLIAHKEQS